MQNLALAYFHSTLAKDLMYKLNEYIICISLSQPEFSQWHRLPTVIKNSFEKYFCTENLKTILCLLFREFWPLWWSLHKVAPLTKIWCIAWNPSNLRKEFLKSSSFRWIWFRLIFWHQCSLNLDNFPLIRRFPSEQRWF